MNLDLDSNKNIVVTCGSTEAMMAAMMSICDPSDKVIVFSPFYENYGADSILCGANPIYVPLHPPVFNFDKEELENAFKQNPKALFCAIQVILAEKCSQKKNWNISHVLP